MKRLILPILLLAVSCGRGAVPDAYGILEARSWMIAASVPGQIVSMDIHEGDRVDSGEVRVMLDTARLSLQKKALEARMDALRPTLPEERKQIDVLEREKRALASERSRLEPLVASGSVSSKQLDAIDDKISVVDSKITAARSSIGREKAAVLAEMSGLASQLDILNDEIARCSIVNPERGTVTAKYVNLHEFVTAGMPVYKLSDYENLYVDAWLDGDVLSKVSLGSEMDITVDAGSKVSKTLRGTISYIAQEAEFTPNKVMTRDTRATMVYHVRIDILNDGLLRAGMPAEVRLPR